MKTLQTTLLAFTSLILLVACTTSRIKPESQQPEATASPQPSIQPTIETPPPAMTPEDGPLQSGEVPQELFNAALADLLAKSDAVRSDVQVLMSEAVVWNDGSLGCPQPDVMYTQALVDGYQIIFRVGDREYDYHLSANGAFVLCDSALPNLPGGTPTE